MTAEELEKLKAEVESKMASLKEDIDSSNDEMIKRIDQVYENELRKTLDAIGKRLTAIEKILEDAHGDKEDTAKATLRTR